jgi:hypothetical protein
MLTLPKNIRKNGFDYVQVLRGKRSCIYEQKVTPRISYYEVFLIVIKPERSLFGKTLPEREVFPKDEDFGFTAWTYRNLDIAKMRFIEFEKN